MSDGSGAVAGLKVLKAIVWFIYIVAGAAVIVLAFGFGLLLFDANPASGFVEFIYGWSTLFAQPFAGMIAPAPLPSGGVISWSMLFAIAAYAVLAWILGAIMGSISARIYRDTARQTVGQKTVVETHPLDDGGTVATETTVPVVEPSAAERADAEMTEGEGAGAHRRRPSPSSALRTQVGPRSLSNGGPRRASAVRSSSGPAAQGRQRAVPGISRAGRIMLSVMFSTY